MRLWTVTISHQASKGIRKLPKAIQEIFAVLALELEKLGPERVTWKNYGKLKKDKTIPSNSYHCHLKKGRPTYVACWRVSDQSNRLIEIFYVGTHEKAPY